VLPVFEEAGFSLTSDPLVKPGRLEEIDSYGSRVEPTRREPLKMRKQEEALPDPGTQFSAHGTGMQVPHRADPEVSQENAHWRPAPHGAALTALSGSHLEPLALPVGL
jgi:hypothetical protein